MSLEKGPASCEAAPDASSGTTSQDADGKQEANRTAGTDELAGTPHAKAPHTGTTHDYLAHHRRNAVLATVLIAVVVLLFLVALGAGRSSVTPADVVGILGQKYLGAGSGSFSDAAVNIVCNIRLPRVIAALLVGAALAISGASYQGIFKNPMVSPDILGASAGASFGAALALLWSFDNRMVQVMAFIMGFVAVGLTYFSARRIGRNSNQILLLVLCGLIVGTLFQAFVSAIKYTADPDSKLPEITYWLMGSIAKITWDDLKIFLFPFIVGAVPLLLMRWKLNTLSFGDEEAESLGVNVSLMRGICILCATLLTSAVVSIAGVVGWVGLIIPHLVRFIFGPDNRIVLPMSLFAGAGFMILVDMACRTLMASEIPLGILTSIIGAPFFFAILLKTRKELR